MHLVEVLPPHEIHTPATLEESRRQLGNVWFAEGVPEQVIQDKMLGYLNVLHSLQPGYLFGLQAPRTVCLGMNFELEAIAAQSRVKKVSPPSFEAMYSTFMSYMNDAAAHALLKQNCSAKPRAITMTLVHGLDEML